MHYAAAMALLPWVAALYGAASLACFIAYASDKRAARRGARRTPERTLLMLGLACGWPGGWAAQRWLRHKSSKTGFLLQFWLSVALNIAALTAVLYFFPFESS